LALITLEAVNVFPDDVVVVVPTVVVDCPVDVEVEA
jgi:hypothetical protein